MLLALFGIDGGALGLVINLLVIFLIVVYLALIYWTYLDARRRIEDPVLIACATAASVFPFVGTVDLHDPAPARVPRGPRGARARAARGGAPAAAADRAVLPPLRVPDRRQLPSLSQLRAAAAQSLPKVPQAARPEVGDLPVLRDRGSQDPRAAGARDTGQASPPPGRGRRAAGIGGAQRRWAEPRPPAALPRQRPGTPVTAPERPAPESLTDAGVTDPISLASTSDG